MWNGTGANCVSLAALCRPWESVICAETAHITTDECGAPEHIANVKLVAVSTPDGKLTPELVRPPLPGFGFEHHAQPRVISVSNVTELGTVYTPAELRALADLAHEHGCCCTWTARASATRRSRWACRWRPSPDAGVDALSLGGTKNGMLARRGGRAVRRRAHGRAAYVRKQSAQLASKMRFVAAQFLAMYGATVAPVRRERERMAARLAEGRARAASRSHSPAGQRDLRAAAGRADPRAPGALPLLRVGGGRRRGALAGALGDVVGHRRRGRRRIRRRSGHCRPVATSGAGDP